MRRCAELPSEKDHGKVIVVRGLGLDRDITEMSGCLVVVIADSHSSGVEFEISAASSNVAYDCRHTRRLFVYRQKLPEAISTGNTSPAVIERSVCHSNNLVKQCTIVECATRYIDD